VTDPDADPLDCAGNEIQLDVVAAVHWQPESVETSNPTEPPLAATVSPDRLIAYVHAAAACESCRCCVSTTISLVRAIAAWLLAMV
jgi:hypothetical protein